MHRRSTSHLPLKSRPRGATTPEGECRPLADYLSAHSAHLTPPFPSLPPPLQRFNLTPIFNVLGMSSAMAILIMLTQDVREKWVYWIVAFFGLWVWVNAFLARSSVLLRMLATNFGNKYRPLLLLAPVHPLVRHPTVSRAVCQVQHSPPYDPPLQPAHAFSCRPPPQMPFSS